MADKKEQKSLSLSELEEKVKKQSEKLKTHPVFQTFEEKLDKEKLLLEHIKEKEEEIRSLYEEMKGPRVKEEVFYRFYHTSFKTFNVQEYTQKAVSLLLNLFPDSWNQMHPYFKEIYNKGTYKPFNYQMNNRWTYEAGPVIEAYNHTLHLMEMLIKYGLDSDKREREGNPGWFTVLYFYKIR